jgi:hypothetical protein
MSGSVICWFNFNSQLKQRFEIVLGTQQAETSKRFSELALDSQRP